MPYTSLSLIKNEFRQLDVRAAADSNPTAVTEEDVAEFIAQAESYINAKIAKKYTLPIVSASSPNGFNILKTISTYMVVCRIRGVLEIKNVIKEADQIVKTKDYCKEAQQLLDEVVDGSLLLPDAPQLTGGDGRVDSFNIQNCTPYVFKTDEEQW
jgi:hypothetical protein